jgi:hypothetical protein
VIPGAAPSRPKGPPQPTPEEMARWRAFLGTAEKHFERMVAAMLSGEPLPMAGRMIEARKRVRRAVMPVGQFQRGSPLHTLVSRVDLYLSRIEDDRRAEALELCELVRRVNKAMAAPPPRRRPYYVEDE